MKSKLGCGTPILIKFYAPLNLEDASTDIDFDFKSLGEDEMLLKNDEYMWCVKQCYKMCFYIQLVYKIEVLKFKAEFSKDENGTVSNQNMCSLFLDLVCLCIWYWNSKHEESI